MSIGDVENIHIRLRDEIKRCGYSLADAARAIGDPSSQNLRDVVSGRKKCPAELVGRLAVIGVDIFHILTGHPPVETTLSSDENALIDNYRHLCDDQKNTLSKVSEAMTAGYQADKTSEG